MTKHTINKKIMAAAVAILASGGAYAQCLDGNCEDGYGVYQYEDGTRYEGYWSYGFRDGFGMQIMPNGDTYIGQFDLDHYNGNGTYTWAENGNKYIGHWQKSNRQGIGTYISADGTVQRGLFNNDEMLDDNERMNGCINGDCKNGFGVYIYNDGSIYEGEWIKKKPNGQGRMTENGGAIYEGEFLDGEYYGFGVRTAPDGTQKAGMWENNRFVGEVNTNSMKGEISGYTTNGYGIWISDDGSYYMGYWKDDKMHGQGTLYRSDGVVCDGCWEQAKMNGYGKVTFAENDESGRAYYVGDIRNDEFTGFGTMVWKDGSVFYGQFVGGLPNGQGVMIDTDKNGEKISGVWKDGQCNRHVDERDFDLIFGSKNGFGIKLNEYGRYAGQLSDGAPNGQGTLRCHSGFTVVGNCFKDGKNIGEGMLECPDGRRYVGYIEDASANGKGTIYYPDGSTFSGTFKNGDVVEEKEEVVAEVAKPEVSWTTPQLYNTETTSTKAQLEICVTSKEPLQEVLVYVNGVVKYKDVASRGFKVVTSKCDHTVKCEVELEPGKNEIYATIKNAGGTTKTDIRTITLQKSDKISEEKRVALVIGNSSYQNILALPNPKNDANLMASTLQQLGFETIVSIDLSKDDMIRKIKEFGQRLSETKGVGLFFYAGHGLQVDGINYLVPVNASIDKKQDVEFECVNLQRLLGEMDYAENDLNIVILDACRNNPFAKMRAVNDGGLAAINAPKGTYIAFATAPGSTASDGDGDNGLYTSQLVKYIKEPGIKLEDVFKKTRSAVYGLSDKQQVPWENSSIFGDFFFQK